MNRKWLELSLAQQAIWIDAAVGGASAYQLGVWARLDGPLDPEAFRQAIALVMARHDALRLRVDAELPRQWLSEAGETPFRVIALDLPGDADEVFQGHVRETFARPMPLGDHPLFEVEMVRCGEASYVLCRFHHLIADQISTMLVQRALLEAYEAQTGETSVALMPPSSFQPQIAADAAYLKSAAYQRDLAYWSSRFDPLPEPLIAPLEARADAPEQVPVETWLLAGADLAAARRAAEEAQTTLPRAVFALSALALGRRYGRTDVVAGVALHRRELNTQQTVGMFSGVLPIRCQFEAYWSLTECIQAFGEQMDADLQHHRMPVDGLSRSMGLAASGRGGLFEVAMSYLPAGRAQDQVPGRPVDGGVVQTKEASPLSIHAGERENGLLLTVAANPDFLPATEPAAVLALLRAALRSWVEEPETRLEELATVSEAEQDLVLGAWSGAPDRFPGATLEALFAEQARRDPDALALIGLHEETYTYGELDTRSTRLAHYLRRRGVGFETVVGVRWPRSAETVIAILGILKAGGVYLPLDPAYPPERLDYIAADAQALFVLDELPELDGLDDAGELPAYGDPERLAYIIYTSGTTGQPKGVAVPHRAAVNLDFARRAAHDPIGPGDRILAAISVGFDVSIGQLLLPLLSGATIVVSGELKTMGAAEFWALIARRGVTHINSVPSFVESILEAAPGEISLRRLMLGGEPLSGSLVERIGQRLPGVAVVNMYGPTEACIDATYHVAGEADLAAAVLPIGRPLPNYTAYILDGELNPAGVGVAGELYLGGAGLARGYVNEPALTAARFIADPFSSAPGARLYRTGDRARWRPDGAIEFLGRADQQVKIRGFRVEPAEVASVLLEHPGIAQAVVVPTAGAGGQRLAAYFVARQEVPAPAELHDHLARRLPDYMVPAAFVALAAIPINANGKLDQRALPAPELPAGEYVAPRSAAEELIAGLFASVLGLERCGADGHFFELGGHSLLATSLVSKLRQAGIDISLREVFATPTVEGLARRLEEGAAAARKPAVLTPPPRPEAIPLSLPQERIWFVDRLQQDASYNIPMVFELRGKLDHDALTNALTQMVARHEALRTRIVLRDGRPWQEVHEAPPLDWRVVELDAGALAAKLRDFASQRFELAAEWPFRQLLMRLGPEHHVLCLLVHHVAFDGWSANVFLREFAALYQRQALPGLVWQYADFAVWQREQSQEENLAFWREELRDAPARLELPVRTSAGGRRAGTLPLRIDAPLHAALLQLARDHGASLFMVLHAAFALLMARWSGQNDVVVGTVVANRPRSEFEAIVGCFVNTLALRTQLDPRECFSRLLRRVKTQDLAAFEHQSLPFEQLVEALQPERSLDHTPIFQVMLVLQNAPLDAVRLPGLTVTPLPVEPEAAKFDLTLTLAEQTGELQGTLEFAAGRLAVEDVARFGRRFVRLLEAVAAEPEQECARIDLLEASERQLVTREWSGQRHEFPLATLDELFERQARQTPEAIAVVTPEGDHLTYAVLAERVRGLAAYLAERGVGPGGVVGVQMPRSVETIIAALAILRAGGVYLPLDPAYPADRLAYMAEDAGALFVLDSIAGLESDRAFTPPVEMNRLAYIIYTSGTTGRPKGVAVEHAAAVNLLHARRVGYDPIGPGDRILASTSIGFDVSVGQLLFPLLNGATVVLAGDVRVMGPARLWQWIEAQRVTQINFVPSFFASLLEAAPPGGLPQLRRILLGGEALPGALAARVRRMLPGVKLFNVYGPTETCIDATSHEVTAADEELAVLPIGRPLANYEAYILDDDGTPTGPGMPGELYLGGAGLARGYVNAAELTAERFVPNPFGEGRLYRTGDRARWRSDGALEFLGRADEQVKIRGFRIELGEIEAQIRRLAGVREAAVVADKAGAHVRLIGYFAGAGSLTPEDLRVALAAALPEYMVPAAFVRVDHLPLSPNGKLDRKALPTPPADAFASRAYEAPLPGTEEKMAALWAELLRVERVGRYDNFFELGGHSLLAVTLIDRMEGEGLPGDIRALFTTPTVAGLASAAAVAQAPAPENRIRAGATAIAPEDLPLVALTQAQIDAIAATVPGGASNIQDIYPLAPLQEGILFQHLITPEGDPYISPSLLAFDTPARREEFLAALQSLVARHDVLRTAMFHEGLERPVQVVLRQAAVPVSAVGQMSPAALRDKFDSRHYRLDLSQAPLLAAMTAEDGERCLLLLLAHHLVLDHTSMEILVSELRALMAEPAAPLATPLPYRNFIAQTLQPAAHEEYFRKELGGLEEPTAPYGLRVGEGEAREVRERLSPQVARRLREQARRLGVTPASLFHLAWGAVLAHVAGQREVVFGTVLFGRMRSGAGADRVVGMFINTLPLRLAVDDTPLRTAVGLTQERLAGLLEHEHAPLALAQRCSGVTGQTPLFTSLFNYRYSPAAEGETEWPGVEMLHSAERTNYPVAMAVDDTGEGFLLTALVVPEAEPLCRFLATALESLVDLLESAPETPVSALRVMPAEERAAVAALSAGSEPDYPLDTLERMFAAQVARTPDALALVGVDGATWSYAELDGTSTKVARQLAARGIRPGDVVGVRMPRSADTVMALLGILKAGAVYLPLDPAYPDERLDYLAANAEARLVLRSLEELAAEAEIPPVPGGLERRAYIIYTSGTSGQPKGVAVPHRAAANLALARIACHDPIGGGDRILAGISVGFDVSIGQLLLPLLSGAAVVIAPELKTLGAGEFWSLIVRRGVTHINSVPSFIDSILEAVPGPTALKRLMLGGEALSGALVARIGRKLPGVQVVNMYGPTEACIDATYHVASPEDLDAAVLPIGRPLAHYTAHVLDERQQVVGRGVAGELYLGGRGLADGYLGLPELTAERFQVHATGERLYRTGDRARWRADGVLEFLGRVDEQVKIRGFRVEPAEIEANLRRQPGVAEAAVVALPAGLVAYFTGTAEAAELRTALAATLPDYMVPAAFVALPALPLTPNGKLDRRALPKPDMAARAYEAPQGELEIRMAAIWSQLLQVPQVGRHDNFFELGGHSLLAVSLIERLRQQGLHADVRSLFTHATVADLVSTLKTASAKRTILEVPQAVRDRVASRVPGGAANLADVYPLAPLQEGILFEHLRSGAGDPYLVRFLLGFDERERLDAFLAALDHVVARHDVLRTGLVWQEVDEPLQYVLREARVPVEELAALAPEELLGRFAAASYRLDLRQAPMLRAVVAARSDGAGWMLLLLTHHLILDHTSMEIVVGELRALMTVPGITLPLSPPYRLFVEESRASLAQGGHEEYFRKELGGLEEPTAPYGLRVGEGEAREVRERLSPQVARRLREQARRLGVTPASLFHLAWGAVLAHVAGQREVVFGTVLFGRMRSGAGADRVVGMFINTLPLRLAVDDTPLRTAVGLTQERLAGLLEHEHAPLALAQRCSGVTGQTPLFTSLFNYRYSPAAEGETEWPGVEMLHSAERTNYPVAMAVDDTGEGFLLTALVVPEAEPLCRFLATALESLVDLLESAPETPVSALRVMPAEERAAVAALSAGSEPDYPLDTLERMFAAQVARTPDALALVGVDGATWSYAELDGTSTKVARQLAARGIRPGDVVGVRMPRSADTVMALLGILKAGAVYLPLDPAYPDERLDYLAANAEARLVLRSLEELAAEAEIPPVPGGLERRAYIIYTSGTSGQPKGVAVPHRAAANLALARIACHDPIGGGDRILAGISVGFDVSIGQLLLPLLSGAAVVIAPELKTLGAGEFWSLIVRRGVTHINSVPSFIDSILEAVPGPTALKRLMLGGEALSGALVARIGRKLPGVQVVNMYGPTEACIDATYHVASPEDLDAAVLPIGRPLAHYTAHVLDERQQVVGRGVAGELYLGGRGLADGYLGLPELTAERFQVHATGERLYRTGDRARWRADGVLEFLGRVDEQVKIRGFRVEPAEIEANLRRQPGVAEAAVVALPAGLVAYFTGTAEAAELRTALAATLPDYMVPAAFVALPALPLTPNGKLDRRALPKPDMAARAYEAPQGELEIRMAAIWSQLLQVPRVGRHDNFFELGGDSLGAMRLVSAVESELGVSLPIAALFAEPTVAALAAASAGGARRSDNLVPLQTGGSQPSLFCIHPAGGHVFCYLPLARALGPDYVLHGLQASGLEETDELGASIAEMATQYIREMRRVQPQGPYHLLGMSSGGLIAFEMARQLAGEAASLVMLDTTVPGTESGTFHEQILVQAMAGELGCADLAQGENAPGSLDELFARADASGRLPAGFTLAQLHRLARVFRNTVKNHFAYRPERQAGGALLVRALRRTRAGDAVPDWSPYFSGPLEVVDLDCTHEDLVSAALAPAIAPLVRAAMAEKTE